MKRIIFFTAGMVGIFLASCSGTKYATSSPNSNIVPWTTTLAYTCNFSDDEMRSIDFYNSDSIVMYGEFFSTTAFVDNGVVHIVDTISTSSRTFPAFTRGSIVGIPQRSPLSAYVQSYTIRLTKGDIAYDFTFSLSGNEYVLNRKAKATYDGKEYAIYVTGGRNNYVVCRLLCSLQRTPVVIHDDR